MPKIKPLKRALLLAGLLLLVGAVGAQPAPPSVRLRGAIEKADAASLVVKERDGRVIPLVYADNLAVSEVVPIDPSVLQSGTFVGATAVPGPDGSLLALQVHVFAEAARGTGEGHRPSDLQPGATMTNAAVASVAAGADDRILVLRYKDGEKTIRVPNGVPVVTMRPGDRSLLVAGAKVIVTGQMRDGRNVATRIIVGRNGFAPPM